MSSRGWLLFAAMSVIWGIPYLLIKVAVEGVSVPVLVLARTAVGAAVLLPLAMSRAAWAPVLRHWKPVLAFAFFEIVAAWLLLSDAERHLTSSMTGLLIAASPIIAAVLDRLTGGERLGAKRIAGLAVGLSGVAVLAGPGLTGGHTWPIIEVLLVATCYAIAPLIAGRYLGEVPTLPLTAACLTIAAVVYTAPAALTWPDEMPSRRVLMALAGLAVLCTALAFILFFALIREVGPARALVFTYVNPAVALAAGVIVLGEPLTAWNVAGLALILTGSVLATRKPPEPETEAEVEAMAGPR
ncbi:integral membrane protein [Mycolicibacterium mageritense DSM 44476 = CIP 104973]|uniref:Inner membrane transporter YedA n=1 Tax=Mycolicibacterium mageritense TaxID=53462 RepID=A0AAI8TYA5_MYCME|nr:DMT family transporter [Mycolicibacterium mageritense]MCC9183047.1 DMT family transporter [Mycolicibacterium mageritense]CDO19653.1 integral membrane protein [Mycolicibacterium mageritense DSM 44476 = CIP 104973]BBX35842.1 membrane protein [Mycolicibacterium mageritense]BDY30725.1 putative inner membrane transporter YedA [Mycolicibacterium mageritense]GJJ17525.1 membrane protein [Mycolicibacterium mageritense]